MEIVSDFSLDLVEEVLSRVPLTSLRSVRFTCKKWNDLSKNRSFINKQIVEAKKKQAKQFQMIMMKNFRVYLLSVDLHSNVDPSITVQGELISLNDDANLLDNHHQVGNISTVLHCDGLLLCITKDLNFRLMVWNPYFGQTMWIKPRNCYHSVDDFALGYDERKQNKILRFVDNSYERICEFEVYSFESNSWKVVLDVSPDWDIKFYYRGLSLKGNTYWYATQKLVKDVDFLICFDFTTERFGPRLPLPFNASPSREDIVSLSSVGEEQHGEDIVSLSSVGEEQLAVLFQDGRTLGMEIWITSKIEPTEVSWNKSFLAVNMRQFIRFEFLAYAGTFFIDKKKNIVVVFDTVATGSMAYIIGKGYFKKEDLGEGDWSYYSRVCSYVPSSVQIKQLT